VRPTAVGQPLVNDAPDLFMKQTVEQRSYSSYADIAVDSELSPLL